MTPLLFTLCVLLVSFSAGLLGSLVGVGGGIIVVPALTLLFGVDIRHAIGASIISVIATSSGAAASYVKEHMTNLRVAMLLELATVAGAVCGACATAWVSGRWLYLLFGLVLAHTAANMLRKKRDSAHPPPADRWADRLRLHGRYYDVAEKRDVYYRVARTRLGFGISYLAGILSGLLGIGGGVIKVPVMNLGMGIPIKVATATSNFMIGVTAAASAAVYFMRGDVLPFVAAPVAAGVLLGATTGSQLLGRARSSIIRLLFVIVLVATSLQMLLKGIR